MARYEYEMCARIGRVLSYRVYPCGVPTHPAVPSRGVEFLFGDVPMYAVFLCAQTDVRPDLVLG